MPLWHISILKQKIIHLQLSSLKLGTNNWKVLGTETPIWSLTLPIILQSFCLLCFLFRLYDSYYLPNLVTYKPKAPFQLFHAFSHFVRYQSPMDLQQVHSALPSSAIPFLFSSPSYFCHIPNTSPFIPVPLVSSFIPMFPVSLISVPMSLWSSHLSHIVFLPHSCLSLFHTSTFVPSPWLSQADPAA